MLKASSINKKLLIVSFISLTIILFYSTKSVISDLSTYNNSRDVIKVVELSVHISNVVHEMQKERGASAGFLGSKGKKFAKKLLQQREITDSKLSVLNAYLVNEENNFTSQVSQLIDFSSLQEMRSKVDVFSVKTKVAVGFYTALNKSSLDIISQFSTYAKENSIRNMLNSFILFISAKERAGIERAILSATFAKDKFNTFLNAKFLSVMAQQQALFNLFESSANQGLLLLYKQIKSDPAFAEVQKMRDIALSKQSGFGIDSSYWFKTITVKINQLKKMENNISMTVINTAKAEQSHALYWLIFEGLFSLFVIIFISWLNYEIRHSIMEKIYAFKYVIGKVRDGDLSSMLEHKKNSSNEMDQIAELFQSLITIMQDLTTRISTSIHYASKGDFKSCELNEHGFEGDFKEAIENVMSGIDAMHESHKKQNIINFNGKLRSINDVGSSISLIQHELVTMVDDLKDVLITTNDTSTKSSDSLVVVEEILSKLKVLVEKVDQSNDIIGGLDEKSNEITSVVDLIKSIAEQTNLLALNAAIEAARAGEHGRGFSVVADEVRNLAEHTQKATSEIADSIEGMRKVTSSIVDKSGAMSGLANDVSTSVENFKDVMNQLNGDTMSMSHVVEDIENQAFIVLAKIDHIAFKSNAYNAMIGVDASASFSNHKDCRLGKWYASTGKENFSATESYAKVDSPHALVHAMVQKNMEFIKVSDKRLENKETILNNYQQMEQASADLFALLDNMRFESVKRKEKIK